MTRHILSLLLALLLILLCGAASLYAGETMYGDGGWRRDPFRYGAPDSHSARAAEATPAVESAVVAELPARQPELKLQGIFLGRDGSYHALINGREVGAGALVGELRILRISRFAIVVKEADGTREIDLFHNQIIWGEQ